MARKKIDDEIFEKLGYDIVKYQNFKTEAIVSKVDYPLAYSTLSKYIEYGIRYIKRKVRTGTTNPLLYTYIDKAIAEFVQPLTPGKYEKRNFYKVDYTKKEQTPPVAKLQMVHQPVIAEISYGVKLNDTIKLFENKQQAILFAEGAKFTGCDVSVVTVELGEV